MSIPELAEVTAFNRVYLALFFTVVAVFYTGRVLLLQRCLGQGLVFPGTAFCASWWNHMAFRLFRAAIWLLCLARLYVPGVDVALGLFAPLQGVPVLLTGAVLLTLGFAMTLLVHFSLGQGWRSGIDPGGPARLQVSGWYCYSRNPMFLSIALAQLGFFLALPSVFALVCLLLGLYTLQRQVRAEEQHLAAVFADDYARYAARVPRWL
ncbi:isoprenylcysteine carboxylmethyltransferase family protein [Marinobacterium sp. A346]|uniref:Isoprenylcysteine carboxylmethyltransferase family protein n=1 Tax=Marinobacterium weihaiense TaxID=2851016 RepID=A0ABS6MDA9_9GAMM|nr:isoprenylcysteine carboxylmethyltransferase family protein [Marinobacterium weihaiense]